MNAAPATLGERIKQLRGAAGLSLRELGRKAGGKSAVFLSDVELGRRFPSENSLGQIAAAIGTTIADLRRYDTRAPVETMKRRVDKNPSLALAFRMITELPDDEILRIASAVPMTSQNPTI